MSKILRGDEIRCPRQGHFKLNGREFSGNKCVYLHTHLNLDGCGTLFNRLRGGEPHGAGALVVEPVSLTIMFGTSCVLVVVTGTRGVVGVGGST